MTMRSEEGVRLPGTEVTDACELSHKHWDLTLEPLQEQQMLLTHKPTSQTQKMSS